MSQFYIHRIETTEAPYSCQHCGHEIKNLFHLKNKEGRTLTVGSDCVEHFVGYREAVKAQNRISRAARQWRANKPERKPSETRSQYIERRVFEMANARRAAEEWCLLYKQFNSYSTRLEERWRRLIKAERTWHPGNRNSLAYAEWSHSLNYKQIKDHVTKKLARKFKANPFDFMRPMWEVSRI